MQEDTTAKVLELERRIADLKARLPKHSIPPTMLVELEELEEALARVLATQGGSQ